MAAQVRVVWDEGFTRYDWGPTHPMHPVRLALTASLVDALGLGEAIELVSPEQASDEVLATVHDPAYVAGLRAISDDPASADGTWGVGTDDDPGFRGMHEVAATIAGGTLEICRAVWQGEAEHGVNYCGGLHHAMPDHASGFCVYNDAAIGIRWLLDNGAERVCYVDLDAHHGDGVERIFWDDPRVLTISVHETGRVLFPGTGFPGDTGGPGAPASAANVALPPGTGDAAWLRAVHAVVPALVRAFAPDVLVTQHGADPHREDPLAHFALTVDGMRLAAESMHELAHEVCGGRWVALGGGGYAVVEVVPRAWAHLVGIAAHRPVPADTPVPPAWLAEAEALTGVTPPPRMGDLPPGEPLWFQRWEMGFDPDTPLDQAIMATREALFPSHGLDVWFD